MSNVIERAEMLVDDFPKSLLRSCEFCDRAADLLPGLLAECKRLQEDNRNLETLNAALMENGNDLRERAQKAESQAAYWRQKAIEERGKLIRLGFGDVIDEIVPSHDERRVAIQDAIIALVAAEQYDGAEGGSLGVDEATMATMRAMLAEAER